MPSAKSEGEAAHAWATQLVGPAGKYPPLEPPRQVPVAKRWSDATRPYGGRGGKCAGREKKD